MQILEQVSCEDYLLSLVAQQLFLCVQTMYCRGMTRMSADLYAKDVTETMSREQGFHETGYTKGGGVVGAGESRTENRLQMDCICLQENLNSFEQANGLLPLDSLGDLTLFEQTLSMAL